MKKEWKTCLRIGISAFLLYLCITYWPKAAGLLSTILSAASPLLLGCAIAYVLNILMCFYERRFFRKKEKGIMSKIRRPICLAGAILTLLAILALVVGLVLPQLLSCIQLIISQLPGFMAQVVNKLREWEILPENILDTLASVDWKSKISQIAQVLTSGIGSVLEVLVTTVTSVFSGVVTLLLGIIFSIYLLGSKERLGRQCTRVMQRYLPERVCQRITHVRIVLDDCFHRYIVGQCTEALILGVLCMIGMLILQLPYAGMIGALVAVTALIPVAGAYIGAIVGAFLIVMVSPAKALIFLIFLVVLQQLEGNLIYPRVVGSSIGLPAIWVLAAVTVGGGVMGVLGMLLGVPLTAALYRLLREHVNQQPPKKQEIPPEQSGQST